jgi:hypothetical protein
MYKSGAVNDKLGADWRFRQHTVTHGSASATRRVRVLGHTHQRPVTLASLRATGLIQRGPHCMAESFVAYSQTLKDRSLALANLWQRPDGHHMVQRKWPPLITK